MMASEATLNNNIWYKLAELAIPIIAGSLTTLLGVTLQKHLNERERRNQSLYVPLRQNFERLSDGELTFEEDTVNIESCWSGVDAQQKYVLNREVRETIDDIDNDLSELSQFLSHLREEISNECTYENVLMSSSSPLPAIVAEKRGGHTMGHNLSSWIRRYYSEILEAENGSGLKQKLSEAAAEEGPLFENAIETWDNSDFEDLQNAVEKAQQDVDISKGDSARETYTAMRQNANQMSTEMKSKIDSPALISY